MKITLIGSVSQSHKFVDTYHQLEKIGHNPYMHEHMFEYAKSSWEAFHNRPVTEHAETKLANNYIKWWYNSIVNSDAVLVLNFDKEQRKNHIGGNTLMEMGFAHVNDKKVFVHNPLPEDSPYLDELQALATKIIYGDLKKIA